jgi:hypothetical protein
MKMICEVTSIVCKGRMRVRVCEYLNDDKYMRRV